ncbi:MAG: hypothetical protein LM588_02600 [Fervidicoccaceae archaeon]|nr:hypothetical protein [Fervidicoccaceae archaeon]
MAEEYFRPDEMINQSIAEMNLTEEIAGIIDIITKEGLRLTELFNALCGGKVELVKKGYEYIRSLKEDAQLKKEKTMEYLVRVAPSLLNREIYTFALYHLDTLSQQLDELAFKLSIAASELSKVDGDICLEATRVVQKLKEMLDYLLASAKSINVNRTKALELTNRVINYENDVDIVYRSLEQRIIEKMAQSREFLLAYSLMREVLSFAEGTADLARDIAYDLKYIVFYRK